MAVAQHVVSLTLDRSELDAAVKDLEDIERRVSELTADVIGLAERMRSLTLGVALDMNAGED